MNTKMQLITYTAIAGLALPGMAMAQTANTVNTTQADMNNTLQMVEEDTNITVSGTIARIVEDDEFYLSTQYGEMKVDINDDIRNWFAEDADELFRVGERITVTGDVDDDFLLGREIDAEYITLQSETYSMNYPANQNQQANRNQNANQGQQANRNQTMDPDYNMFYTYDDQNLRLSGTVKEVKDKNNVIMNYNGGEIEVDISDIRNQSQGYTVDKGDFITVYGNLKDMQQGQQTAGNQQTGKQQKREFEATRIIRTDYAPQG